MKALVAIILSVSMFAQAQTTNEQEIRTLRNTAYPTYDGLWNNGIFRYSKWTYVLYSGHFLVVMVNKLGDVSPVTMGLVREHNRIYANLKSGSAVTRAEVTKLYEDALGQLNSNKREADAKKASTESFIADAQRLITAMEQSKADLQKLNANSETVAADRQAIINNLVAQINSSDSRRQDLERKLVAGNLAVDAATLQAATDAVATAEAQERDASTLLANLQKGRSEYLSSVKAMAPSLPDSVIAEMSGDAIKKLDKIIKKSTSTVSDFQETTADLKNDLAALKRSEDAEKARLTAQIDSEKATGTKLQTTVGQHRQAALLSAANRASTEVSARAQINLIDAKVAAMRVSVDTLTASRDELNALVLALK